MLSFSENVTQENVSWLKNTKCLLFSDQK